MKQYEVIVSDQAIKMLEQHLSFAAQVSASAAHHTNAKIFEAIYSLSTMPERCPLFSNALLPSNQYRKLYLEKWYLILFQIVDSTVYVETILDCRQDPIWLRL